MVRSARFISVCSLILCAGVGVAQRIPHIIDSMNGVVVGAGFMGMPYYAGGNYTDGSSEKAGLYNFATSSVMDLHPAGSINSTIFGGHATGYVGARYNTGFSFRASAWLGPTYTYADLHPGGFAVSYALSANTTTISGTVYPSAGSMGVPVIWHRDTLTMEILTGPSGNHTEALDVSMKFVVGSTVGNSTGFNDNAILWNRTTGSVQTLLPAGFSSTRAVAVSGNRILGSGFKNGRLQPHIITHQEATDTYSSQDMSTGDYDEAAADDFKGDEAVGFGRRDEMAIVEHALYWNGLDADPTDLHVGLSTEFVASRAASIDADGLIYGYAERADGSRVGVVWAVVPEPATMSALALGVFGLVRSRRRPE